MSKILVVDDDRSVVFMLGEVLRDQGHEVVTTLSTADMLSLLAGVDAALVDLHMPGESGVSLVAKIRAYDSGIPVILLTADARAPSSVEVRDAGAFDVMTKPVDIDELAALLDRALSSSRPSELGSALT